MLAECLGRSHTSAPGGYDPYNGYGASGSPVSRNLTRPHGSMASVNMRCFTGTQSSPVARGLSADDPASSPSPSFASAAVPGYPTGMGWLLPEADQWPHSPVLLRFSPRVRLLSCSHNPSCLPINPEKPIRFETALFRGELVVRIKDAVMKPGCDNPWEPGHPSGYAQKKRMFVMMVKGQFKEDIGFDEVISGFQCYRPLDIGTLANMALRGVKMVQNINEDIRSKEPWICNFLAAAADAAHKVSARSAKHDIMGGQPDECLGIWKTTKERRQRLKLKEERQKYTFEKGITYTFGFHSDKFFFTEMRAKLSSYPAIWLYMPDYLNGQGFPFMARAGGMGAAPGGTREPYLWFVELWHTGLLEKTPKDWIRDMTSGPLDAFGRPVSPSRPASSRGARRPSEFMRPSSVRAADMHADAQFGGSFPNDRTGTAVLAVEAALACGEHPRSPRHGRQQHPGSTASLRTPSPQLQLYPAGGRRLSLPQAGRPESVRGTLQVLREATSASELPVHHAASMAGSMRAGMYPGEAPRSATRTTSRVGYVQLDAGAPKGQQVQVMAEPVERRRVEPQEQLGELRELALDVRARQELLRVAVARLLDAAPAEGVTPRRAAARPRAEREFRRAAADAVDRACREAAADLRAPPPRVRSAAEWERWGRRGTQRFVADVRDALRAARRGACAAAPTTTSSGVVAYSPDPYAAAAAAAAPAAAGGGSAGRVRRLTSPRGV